MPLALKNPLPAMHFPAQASPAKVVPQQPAAQPSPAQPSVFKNAELFACLFSAGYCPEATFAVGEAGEGQAAPAGPVSAASEDSVTSSGRASQGSRLVPRGLPLQASHSLGNLLCPTVPASKPQTALPALPAPYCKLRLPRTHLSHKHADPCAYSFNMCMLSNEKTTSSKHPHAECEKLKMTTP